MRKNWDYSLSSLWVLCSWSGSEDFSLSLSVDQVEDAGRRRKILHIVNYILWILSSTLKRLLSPSVKQDLTVFFSDSFLFTFLFAHFVILVKSGSSGNQPSFTFQQSFWWVIHTICLLSDGLFLVCGLCLSLQSPWHRHLIIFLKMGPKTFSAPKVWKRPYTAIYNDNYRYGNSLYSGAVAEIENRSKGYTPYFSAPNASIISDPGVRRAILEAELLTSSDILPANLMESMVQDHRGAAELSSMNHASSMSSANASSSMKEYQSIIEQTTTATTTSGRRGSDSFNTYSSAKELANLESGLEDARVRRRKQLANRPTTMYRSSSPLGGTFYHTSDQGHTSGESILDGSNKDWSLERYYARAVRNAHAPRSTTFSSWKDRTWYSTENNRLSRDRRIPFREGRQSIRLERVT